MSEKFNPAMGSASSSPGNSSWWDRISKKMGQFRNSKISTFELLGGVLCLYEASRVFRKQEIEKILEQIKADQEKFHKENMERLRSNEELIIKMNQNLDQLLDRLKALKERMDRDPGTARFTGEAIKEDEGLLKHQLAEFHQKFWEN